MLFSFLACLELLLQLLEIASLLEPEVLNHLLEFLKDILFKGGLVELHLADLVTKALLELYLLVLVLKLLLHLPL